MKIILLSLSTALFCQSAHSFESGTYRGVNAAKTQTCDLVLIQNPKSISVKNFLCQDVAEQVEIGMDPQDLAFGHSETLDPETNMLMIGDVSSEQMSLVLQNDDASESFTELFKHTGPNKINYSFKTISNGSGQTWFDVPLSKIK